MSPTAFWEALDTAMEPLTTLLADHEADDIDHWEDDDEWRDVQS